MNRLPVQTGSPENESEEYLTVAEAAVLLKVHEDTIRKAIADRRLPALELGPKTFRISRTTLRKLEGAGLVDEQELG